MQTQSNNVESYLIAWNTKRNEIQKLIAEDTSSELTRRHKIGVGVLELKNEDKYGTGAVERLADDLGYHKSTLYEYADVAEMWPSGAFEKLCVRKTTKGMPITFSHLVELTGVKNAKRRASLLEQVFTKSLSVRGLQEKIEGRAKSAAKLASRYNGVEAEPTDLARMLLGVGESLQVVSMWMASLPTIRKLPSTKELAKQLADAVAQAEALRAAVVEHGKLLEMEFKRVESELNVEMVPTSQLSATTGRKVAA